MTILGMPSAFIALIGLSIVMSIGLPILFAIKFNWDPSEVQVDIEEGTAATSESGEQIES